MANIYFTDEHEYIEVNGDIGTVGITSYAQDQLGDVVFVELPEIGTEVEAGDQAGVIESVKAASEVYAPVSGEIVEVNEALNTNPALVNGDPQGDGWFFKLRLADAEDVSTLKDEDDYTDYVANL